MLAAHSTWFADQILNGGPWIVADVIYLDNAFGACAAGSSPPVQQETINALIEYMYTGRKSPLNLHLEYMYTGLRYKWLKTCIFHWSSP